MLEQVGKNDWTTTCEPFGLYPGVRRGAGGTDPNRYGAEDSYLLPHEARCEGSVSEANNPERFRCSIRVSAPTTVQWTTSQLGRGNDTACLPLRLVD